VPAPVPVPVPAPVPAPAPRKLGHPLLMTSTPRKTRPVPLPLPPLSIYARDSPRCVARLARTSSLVPKPKAAVPSVSSPPSVPLLGPPLPLAGLVVVLVAPTATRMQDKQAVRTAAAALGARVTSSLPFQGDASSVVVVVLGPARSTPPTAVAAAARRGWPVVTAAYVHACASQGRRVPVDAFRAAGTHHGTSSASSSSSQATAVASAHGPVLRPPVRTLLELAPLLSHPCTAACQVVRHAYYAAPADALGGAGGHASVELHVAPSLSADWHVGLEAGGNPHVWRMPASAAEAEAVYAALCEHAAVGRTWSLLPPVPGLGSAALQAYERARAAPAPSPTVAALVHQVFAYAEATLAAAFTDGTSAALRRITLQQLDMAESLLLMVADGGRQRQGDSNATTTAAPGEQGWAQTLSSAFYTALPAQRQQPLLSDRKVLEEKQELCRLVRDMLSLREGAGCALFDATATTAVPEGVSAAAFLQYQLLGCELRDVEEGTDEHTALLVAWTEQGLEAPIDAVFAVRRLSERAAFRAEVGDVRMLWHGTRPNHLLGILARYASPPSRAPAPRSSGPFSLSDVTDVVVCLPASLTLSVLATVSLMVCVRSGLLLPQHAHATRTDMGHVGAGIYFSARAADSERYALSGDSGESYMLACHVALGRAYQVRTRTHTERETDALQASVGIGQGTTLTWEPPGMRAYAVWSFSRE
jgi:hypothetical protein